MASCILLTGCSFEPEQKQIEQAVKNSLKQVNEETDAFIKAAPDEDSKALIRKYRFEYVKVEKAKPCTDKGNGIYECIVRLTLKTEIKGVQTNTENMQFIKNKQGDWVVKPQR